MNFVKGDVVYLKSGGPAMTVRAEGYGIEEVVCDWFREHEFLHGNFQDAQLTKENPVSKPKHEVIQGK